MHLRQDNFQNGRWLQRDPGVSKEVEGRTFGPMTQQIRHPGRRKILVSPLMMINGS